MKILTVRQPWASLIVSGAKDIENRTWSTSHRGPLLIQASAKPPRQEELEDALSFARECGAVPPEILPLGGVIGVVTVIDCVRRHPSPWFQGPVGWVLSDARELPFTPCKGRLTLFESTPELLSQIGGLLSAMLPPRIRSLPLFD